MASSTWKTGRMGTGTGFGGQEAASEEWGEDSSREGGGGGRRKNRRAGKKIQKARARRDAKATESSGLSQDDHGMEKIEEETKVEDEDVVEDVAVDHHYEPSPKETEAEASNVSYMDATEQRQDNSQGDARDMKMAITQLQIKPDSPPSEISNHPTDRPAASRSTSTHSPGARKENTREPRGSKGKEQATYPQYDRIKEDWSSDPIVGDIWKGTTADNDTQNIRAPYPTDPNHQTVWTWFYAQTGHHYRNLSALLQQRAIEHLFNCKYGDPHDAEWRKQVRLATWRAVVRANFFWVDPHTGQEVGKPKPVVRPSGIFENHFDAFVECAAERIDRVGRDLPHPEYVKKVEEEVREFLERCERAGKTRQLEHLAFLLVFDEEQRKSALSVLDMQERIRRCVMVGDINWQGLEVMKRGKVPGKLAETGPSTLATADLIWREAGATL